MHRISGSTKVNMLGWLPICQFDLITGWTTYMERVLQEKLHTSAHRGFSYLIGNKALEDALESYKDRPKYQKLVIDFEYGEDPDDAYSSIPYEKGANFLLHLGEGRVCVSLKLVWLCTEHKLGGLEIFLKYAREYTRTFIGQSITTDQWKSHLYTYFKNQGGQTSVDLLDSVDWDVSLHVLCARFSG